MANAGSSSGMELRPPHSFFARSSIGKRLAAERLVFAAEDAERCVAVKTFSKVGKISSIELQIALGNVQRRVFTQTVKSPRLSFEKWRIGNELKFKIVVSLYHRG